MAQAIDHTTVSRIPLSFGAGRSSRLALVVMRDGGVTRVPLPDGGVVTIGRSDKCTIVVPDPLLSREHARVHVRERLEIEDLGSSNGTKVGDRQLAPHAPEPLAVGDVVSLGLTVMLVQAESDVADGAPAPDSVRGACSPVPGGALDRMRPEIERIAAGTIPLLVLGETGAGKDVLATMVHALSPRAAGPLVTVNCAALPEPLLEAELFGYERGSFTGARQTKVGLLESAEGGTVFLDEVGEIPLAIQPKLLRALDRREIVRIGSLRPRPVDVRFVAATNCDLEAEVQRGAFREDLFYRLNGASLVVPPLRERVSEIVPLARAFARDASRGLGRAEVPAFDDDALRLLERYSWPGNVRELRHVIERAVLLSDGAPIGERHLPAKRMSGQPERSTSRASGFVTRPSPHDAQRARVVEALARCDGNQTHAARQLGISRRALITRIAKYCLERPRNGSKP